MKLLRSAFILMLSLLMLATCSRMSGLPNGAWELVSLNGEPVVEGTTISLEIKDGQAGGSSGCNSYGGEVEIDGEKIQFGGMNMTLMACTDAGVMEQEGTYLGALEAVESFKLDGEQLVLSGTEVELVFKKK